MAWMIFKLLKNKKFNSLVSRLILRPVSILMGDDGSEGNWLSTKENNKSVY